MRSCVFAIALASVLALPAAASAESPQRKIFLNGVDLVGVDLPVASFEHCTVSFDAHGDIHITAPGFEIHTKEEGSKAPPSKAPPKKKAVPTELTRHYFLISRESRRGATGYDVSVYINDQRITTVRSNAAAAAIDVTKWVHPGDNQLRLMAAKRGAAGSSKSAGDYLELQLAEGDTQGGKAVVRNTILTYRRNAAERASFQNIYGFEGR